MLFERESRQETRAAAKTHRKIEKVELRVRVHTGVFEYHEASLYLHFSECPAPTLRRLHIMQATYLLHVYISHCINPWSMIHWVLQHTCVL